ncbi:LCP family protein [Modestobacter sp. Leaf380]|uniref:LCP family protein n=1 Tax=Modestobacter sp. Leaf380 TaxID=1736356 RepID=UPI0006F20C91|nr:LCP family protein [Modestobacter sp. Leaf380]KQS68797.1 hypothetical protein ASG41_07780 [Modestobacter sp. Leaf380]
MSHEPVDEAQSDEVGGPTRRRGSPRALRRVLLAVGVLGLCLALVAGGTLFFLTQRYGQNVDRVEDVFAALDPAARPASAAPAAAASDSPVTFLLVGSDTRATGGGTAFPDARSDAIMLARLSADRRQVQVVSIPRDSWVDVPGHGMRKINAAYALGGPTLLVQTVEQLTGVRVDHYAAISFEGLISLTDALGGVDVEVAETTSWGPYTFTQGMNHLDGDQARWYVGQRYDLPGGDFDRVRRQQAYLRAVFTQLFSSGALRDPGRLDSVLLAVTGSIAVDDSLGNGDLLSLALSARDITPDGVDFFTAPVLGTGREGPASVVYLDSVRGERMWGYLRTDSLGGNAEEFDTETLQQVPN